MIAEAAPHRPITVLLVEDDTPTRIITQTILWQRFGCLVDTLSTGDRVVEVIQEGSYDILFLDCFLPGMSGFEIAQAIRSLDGEKAMTYIIGVTTIGKEQCLAAGMSDWIGKPSGVKAYEAALRRWINLA